MSAAGAPAGLHLVPGQADALEHLYRADTWCAADLGMRAVRERSVNFSGIGPPWLKDAAKAWAHRRVVLGYAFSTVTSAAQTFKRFSAYLRANEPSLTSAAQLGRPTVERYLAWLARAPLSDSTKAQSRVFLRALLEESHRHGWAPGLPPDAVVYHDEVRARCSYVPRFLPEVVMAQVESDANLSRLRPDYRHLVVVLTETGLRSGDALALPFDPVVADSSGWPCLRFYAHKTRTENVVPLSERAASAVADQQHLVEATWPSGSPWLFPSPRTPEVPMTYCRFRNAFTTWQRQIGLHDEAGRAVHATPHQLRHSLGTRLLNDGVPQPVVQRLLCHQSPLMTNVYAHLHDSTLREQLERYWATRVDVEGRLLGFDPTAPTAGAEWLKHNLARVADTLPNGYCGRPPQQNCPHPNACLTCADFQTTVQFLPVHRRQAEEAAKLAETAGSTGHERFAANHRRVLANLEKIISALESFEDDGAS